MIEATRLIDPISFPDLLSGGWQNMPFEPFREGVEICELWHTDTPRQGPRMALLRYEPGASVPLHEHTGIETILVLEGGQSDERGHYAAGSVVINSEGSRHSVTSAQGCVVLIHWARPVHILETNSPVESGGKA
ncbi:MAG: cupin domain-containing protein [Burkholderiaceae bacterium]